MRFFSLLLIFFFVVSWPDLFEVNQAWYVDIGLIYITLYAAFMLTKFVMSQRNAAVIEDYNEPFKVAVLLSFYNEDLEQFKACITSLKNQSYSITQYLLYDDGSKNSDCYDYAKQTLPEESTILRSDENGGKTKRQFELQEFNHSDITIVLDSDTVLRENAIEEGVKPFSDRTVNAVCGNTERTSGKSRLSTLHNELFKHSFLFERAAQSAIDSVVCAIGMYSLYRTEILVKHADFFKTYYNGISADTRLSTLASKKGRIHFQATARAITYQTNRIDHFIFRHLRWYRGFLQERLVALKHISVLRPMWWMIFLELNMWIVLPFMFLISLFYNPVFTGSILLRYMIIYAMLILYYRFIRNKKSTYNRFILPYVQFMYMFITLPLRLYASLTIRSKRWYTRAD